MYIKTLVDQIQSCLLNTHLSLERERENKLRDNKLRQRAKLKGELTSNSRSNPSPLFHKSF
jgi:hypothetical protein